MELRRGKTAPRIPLANARGRCGTDTGCPKTIINIYFIKYQTRNLYDTLQLAVLANSHSY